MRSRAFLRRLDRLRLPADQESEKIHDLGVLSRLESARLWELYRSLDDEGEALTEQEFREFWALLNKCPLVELDEASSPHRETNEERQERRQLEWAFAKAFHDYAKQYSYLAVPNYGNALNQYRLHIGYQLFEKYGWVVGERDFSTILPFNQWTPKDRVALIDLYQRANPECSDNAPPGWKHK